jgi:phosphatidylinositol dimannoside acyltransferase
MTVRPHPLSQWIDRERMSATAYFAAWGLVRWVPEPVARRAFVNVADRIWRKRGRGVRQLETNLRRVVGTDVTSDELRSLTRDSMRSYLRYWMEVFRLPAFGKDRITERFLLRDAEILWEASKAGHGVIVALPHSGNWDHAGAWLVLNGYPFTTVAQPLRPKELFDRFVAFREGLGMEVLAFGAPGVYEQLCDRLRTGGTVCLIADRDLSVTGVEVDFFGEPARMPAGPAALAIDTGAALLPVTLWYEDDCSVGRIHPQVPVPARGNRREKMIAMTQHLARAFEETIAAHPEDWHMLQRIWTADFSRDGVPR